MCLGIRVVCVMGPGSRTTEIAFISHTLAWKTIRCLGRSASSANRSWAGCGHESRLNVWTFRQIQGVSQWFSEISGLQGERGSCKATVCDYQRRSLCGF